MQLTVVELTGQGSDNVCSCVCCGCCVQLAVQVSGGCEYSCVYCWMSVAMGHSSCRVAALLLWSDCVCGCIGNDLDDGWSCDALDAFKARGVKVST
jgi:hypothetical protein